MIPDSPVDTESNAEKRLEARLRVPRVAVDQWLNLDGHRATTLAARPGQTTGRHSTSGAATQVGSGDSYSSAASVYAMSTISPLSSPRR